MTGQSGPGNATGDGGHVTSGGHVADGGPATDLGLLVLTLIWGVNFSVIKAALGELPPLAFNALRFPPAAATLYLLLRRLGPLALPERGDWPRLVAVAALGHLVYQLFFIFGMDATLAGNAAILLATTPVWTTLFSVLRGHEGLSTRVWGGVAATVAGMALVVLGGGRRVGLGSETLQGDLLMAGAAVVWALYTVEGRDLVRKYGSLPVTAWTLWLGAAGVVAVGVPSLASLPLEEVSGGAWAGVAYSGVLAIGVAYLIWYWSVRRIGSSRTAAYSNLIPVVALGVAWVWLGETPAPLQLAGAAVVLAGMTVARTAPVTTPRSAPME